MGAERSRDSEPADSRAEASPPSSGDEASAPAAVVRLQTEEDYAWLRAEMVRAVRRVCPQWSEDRREDLVQKACLRLFVKAQKNEGEVAVNSFFLRRVAFSVMIDEVRRLPFKTEVPTPTELGDQRPVEAPDPQRLAEGSEAREGVRRCLGRLPEDKRHAVTLRLLGHKMQETAALLNCNVKRVENLVYRGLSALRECLNHLGLAR